MAPSGIGSSVRSLSLRVLVASTVCAVAALSPFLPGGPAAAGAQVERGARDVSGYSLSFNGADAYVSSADSPSLRIEKANAFTVAFWVYLRRIDNNALPRFWEKGGAFLCVMGDTSNPRFGTIGLEVANASGTGNANGGASEFWGKTRLQLDQLVLRGGDVRRQPVLVPGSDLPRWQPREDDEHLPVVGPSRLHRGQDLVHRPACERSLARPRRTTRFHARLPGCAQRSADPAALSRRRLRTVVALTGSSTRARARSLPTTPGTTTTARSRTPSSRHASRS